MFGYRSGYGAGKDWGYARHGVVTTPPAYQAILDDLAAQGTPADSLTIAWLDTNWASQPYAVLKSATASAGAKLRGSGSVLAWWGDGTDTTTGLAYGDTDVGVTYGSAATRGIVLLGAPAQWRPSAAYNNSYTMTHMPTSLTIVDIRSQASVAGSISVFTALTGLTSLQFDSTSVTGNVSVLSDLTSLTTLSISNTAVTGDLSFANALTALTKLFLATTSVSNATSPTLNSAASLATLDVRNSGLAQAAVDTVLSDCVASLGLGGRVACTVKISQNAAPSSTGYDDKATLVSAGWTVTTA